MRFRHFYTLNSFFKYFVKIGEILYNPIARIDIPARKEKPVVRLTQDEIRKVLAAVDSGYRKHNGKKRLNKKYILRDKTILVLFLSTGIRLSELIGLDRGNIDMDNASFEVQRKGGRREVCYMTAKLVEHIKIYLQSFPKASPREPMFMNLYNHRISTASVQRMVQSYCKVAGVTNKITPHKLRSTFGTSMYEKTRDIYLVSELLGHKDVRTTRTHYTTIKEEIKREALTGFQIA